MVNEKHFLFMFLVLFALTCVGYAFWYTRQNGLRILKNPGVYISLFPGFLTMLLITILMIVMHREFNGWPDAIGTRNFSPTLYILAETATGCFYGFLLLTLFIAPVIFLVCHLIPRWRYATFLVSLFTVGNIAVLGYLALLPSGFTYWWWD